MFLDFGAELADKLPPLAKQLVSYLFEIGGELLDKGSAIITDYAARIEEAGKILDETLDSLYDDQTIEDLEAYVDGCENYDTYFKFSGRSNELDDMRRQLDELKKAEEEAKNEAEEKKNKDNPSNDTNNGTSNNSDEGLTTSGSTPAPKDPLIIDLDKDNDIKLTQIQDGVYFDIDRNGFAEKTVWTKGNDGFLVYDRNNNGIIDDGSELFSDQVTKSSHSV